MAIHPPYLNFLGIDPPSDPREARCRVLPVPYDLTTSYQAGTRRGPLAILEASNHLEWYDEELETEAASVGVATLAPVEPDTSGPQAMMDRIRGEASRWIEGERLLVTLGGEHSITAPLVAAHLERWPDLTVLQVDAHADLRNRFEGSPHNHACVMRRVRDMGARVIQVGVRSLTREERQLIAGDDEIITFFAHEIADRPAAAWAVEAAADLGRHVYLTIDLDGLDPSIMPSTGTPEPGGLLWRELTTLLEMTARKATIVGADLVELMPIPGLVAPDFLAAKLAYRIIGLAARQRRWLA
ncbi:MAG: agmatinase [Acidobacteria bacterium]|nr:agmatinase [Acidobacteriota bacterium]